LHLHRPADAGHRASGVRAACRAPEGRPLQRGVRQVPRREGSGQDGSLMFTSLPGVLFDGVAYGSLLFLMSIGLSVTMGLMRFINLAHGAFAMLGGYVCVVGMTRLGVPFLATLPIAFGAAGLAGAVLERILYRRLYRRGPLDQVLFSLGLTLMSVA